MHFTNEFWKVVFESLLIVAHQPSAGLGCGLGTRVVFDIPSWLLAAGLILEM